ncbi:hypothetical protein GCM10022252_65420 [Streptosporangium oxazolinicum]|uniref:Uncharacterized protein n=1 Tax=Streptosporangium oxazolinicum TaxID=909287 RepID=A0ABP8BEU4_9ACTN
MHECKTPGAIRLTGLLVQIQGVKGGFQREGYVRGDADNSAGSTPYGHLDGENMANIKHTYEPHLRISGQPRDLTPRPHGSRLTENGPRVTETAGRTPHTMPVNFGSAVFAGFCPYQSGRGVNL